MTKLRHRVFGKAGIWLRKRKKESGIVKPLSSPKLIGWDDVLCRPIYDAPKTTISSGSSGEDESDCSVNDESSARDDLDQKDGPTPAEQVIAPVDRPIKRRRVFGSCSTIVRKGVVKALPRVSWPVSGKKTLPPTDKPDAESPESSSDATASETPTATDLQTDTEEPFTRSEFDFVDDEEKEPPRQPTCTTTNLDEARRFFQELDSSKPLVLEESSFCKESSKPHVRTRRVVSMDNAGLRADYQEHCRASRESKVKPLPLEAFIRNRSAFFRTDQLYDGFLDE